MAFVPEGRCDRSLARSAWDSATQKCRPVGYGVIRAGLRTDSMIGETKFRIRKTETETRRKCGREIALGLAAPDHTVPYGTVLSRDDRGRNKGWLCPSLRTGLADLLHPALQLVVNFQEDRHAAVCAYFKENNRMAEK